MERNVMGELNVYRGSGAKPNFSEIARRHGMDRHTVAKYWRDGESAADGWIGNTYLDDSGRDSPASLNSTGDM